MPENTETKLGSHVNLSVTTNTFYSGKRVQKGKSTHTLSNIMELILEACAKDEALVDSILGLKK